jgi:hypothetical protein
MSTTATTSPGPTGVAVGLNNSDSKRARIDACLISSFEVPLAEASTGIESGRRDDFCVITHAHGFASDEGAACIGLDLISVSSVA